MSELSVPKSAKRLGIVSLRSWRIAEKARLTLATAATDSYAVGKAIVSHYAYFHQREGLTRTDVLSKYRKLAIEQTGYVID